ncbi:MAG: hypothetical protein J2P18_20010, partial [Nocardia sp.]|nr:hypothetical protein [Nocardia sp.]
MTLTIPPEIPRPVVELVAGPWPEFDEDAGRRRADMFKQLGDAVLAAGNLTGPAGALAVAAIRGQTGETLRGHSADLDGGVRGIANKCYSLEAQCRQGSLQAEFTKYVTIASLAALVLQLGVAAVTPGIGTVAGAAEAAGTRLTIRAAYRALIEALERDALRAAEERAIEKGAALGAGTRLGRTILENGAVLGFIQGGGIPLGAQIVQVAQGHRDGITWSDVGMGAVSGFAGGGLGQFVGGRVMNRLAQRIGAGGFARRGAVQLAGAAAGGVSGLAPGVLVQKAYTGQWDLMPYGLLGGVAGALPHGFRGPPGGPESIGNGHMNTGAGGGARPRTVGAKPRIATSESSTRKTVFADPDATRADGTGRRRWPFRGSSGKLGRSSAVEPHDQQNAPVNKQPGRNRAVEGVPEEPRPENGHGSPPNRLEEEQHDHPEHGDQQGQDQQGQEVPEPPAVDPVATDIADPHAVMDFYHRLHDAAANAGGDSSWQIQQYSMQKALARIFDHSPDSWELKGGQALLAQIDGARPSNDIDLTATSRREVPDMVADYRAAVERPLVGDSLRFVYDHEVPLRRAEGTTVFHRVYIGDMEVMQLSTDLTAPREHPNWAEQFGLDATEEV